MTKEFSLQAGTHWGIKRVVLIIRTGQQDKYLLKTKMKACQLKYMIRFAFKTDHLVTMMTYMGEEPKKRVDVCTCTTDLVCSTAESNTKLYTTYTPIN